MRGLSQVKAISPCIRAKQGNLRRNMPSSRRIEGSDFTRFVETQFTDLGALPRYNPIFTLDERWKVELEEAIMNSPSNKATGTDGIFSEALKFVPRELAEILYEFWGACGRIGHLPNECRCQPISAFQKRRSIPSE